MRGKLILQMKIAVLSGLALLLMLTVQIPIFPPAPFLTYDMSEIPALIAGLLWGIGPGLAVVVLKNLLFWVVRFTPFELIGVPINIVAGVALVGVTSWFYHRSKSVHKLPYSLALGTVVMVLAMIPANMWAYCLLVDMVGVAQLGSMSDYIVACIVPFNLLKGVLSGLLAWGLYRRLARSIS